MIIFELMLTTWASILEAAGAVLWIEPKIVQP